MKNRFVFQEWLSGTFDPEEVEMIKIQIQFNSDWALSYDLDYASKRFDQCKQFLLKNRSSLRLEYIPERFTQALKEATEQMVTLGNQLRLVETLRRENVKVANVNKN